MPKNVASLILDILSQYAVQNIYGVLGDTIFPFLDAISNQDKIRYYEAAQETGAAFMAMAESILTGRLGVCTATSGPGTANILNGLAASYYDKVPVLAITGQVETKNIATKSKQYFNQSTAAGAFSCVSETVTNPDAILPVLSGAIEEALTRQTAVHLSIPLDIFSAVPGDAGFINPTGINWGRPPLLRPRHAAETGDTAKAEGAIRSFKSPVVVLGSRSKSVGSAAVALAQRLGAGVIVAADCRGAADENLHEVVGAVGQAYIPNWWKDADGFVIIGKCPYEKILFPQKAWLVQIAESHDDLYFGDVSDALIGDLQTIVNSLADPWSGRNETNNAPGIQSQWLQTILKEKSARDQYLTSRAINPKSPLSPEIIMRTLSDICDDDAIICLDIGSFINWFDAGFRVKRHDVLLSGRWRSMGSAVPCAIAAKIASPARQVIALAGDGGLLMSVGELAFAAKYKLPIVTVAVNNGGYMLEKQKMSLKNLNPSGFELPSIDFSQIAAGLGMKGFKAKDTGELQDALTLAVAFGAPALIDVLTEDPPLPYLK